MPLKSPEIYFTRRGPAVSEQGILGLETVSATGMRTKKLQGALSLPTNALNTTTLNPEP